jgi:hypothetical protein
MIEAIKDPGVAKAAYTRIIAPFIDELSTNRAQLAASTFRSLKHLGIMGVAGAALLVPFSGPSQHLWLVPPLLALIAGGILIFRRQAQWQERLATVALESVCALAPGMSYELESRDRGFVEPFENAGLIPGSSRSNLRFAITGRYREAEFKCLHAVLRRGSGKNRRIIFDGILAQIEMPREAPFPVVVTPRPGSFVASVPRIFQHPQLKKLAQIEVEGSLSARFVVHVPQHSAANVDQLHDVLTPEVQSALLDIDTDEGHGGTSATFAQLCAALDGTRLYLAFPRQEVRAIGGVEIQTQKAYLSAPFYMIAGPDLTRTFSDIFTDIMLVFRLIDRLR